MYNEPKADCSLTAGYRSLVVNPKNPLYHLFNFIAKEYANDTEKLLKHFTGLLALSIDTGVIKNKNLRVAVKFLKFGVTGSIFGSEFIMHIRNYIHDQKSMKADPFKKRMIKASKLLEIKEEDAMYANLPHAEVNMSTEFAMWFVNRPQTYKVRIKGYYNMQSLEEITKELEFEPGRTTEVAIIFEINKEFFIWDLVFKTGILGISGVSSSYFVGKMINEDKVNDIRKAMLFDFAQSLNYKENTIWFDGWGGLYSKPRRVVLEQINQFDTTRLITEIEAVLEHGRKRAFAFVGKQGVGKSSILRLIEQRLTKYMIIHLTPDDFEYASRIRDRFEVTKLFQPLVLMIEDLDACGLKEKKKTTGAFLDCIDEVNKDLNIVILVSINDTALVHRTIINRPGRFDRVFEIFPPKTIDEALYVVKSKINAIQSNYCEQMQPKLFADDPTNINKVLDRCIKQGFTQAELTNAIAEQALIEIGIDLKCGLLAKTWNDITHIEFESYLDKAVDSHIATRTAIKNCNFHDTDPDDDDEAKCVDKQASPGYGAVEAMSSS